jgi:hypothetical protein
MTDQAQEPTTERLLCPTCGTSLAENATRCVVCGAVLQTTKGRNNPRTKSQITLSLPLALILIAIFAIVTADSFTDANPNCNTIPHSRAHRNRNHRLQSDTPSAL